MIDLLLQKSVKHKTYTLFIATGPMNSLSTRVVSSIHIPERDGFLIEDEITRGVWLPLPERDSEAFTHYQINPEAEKPNFQPAEDDTGEGFCSNCGGSYAATLCEECRPDHPIYH